MNNSAGSGTRIFPLLVAAPLTVEEDKFKGFLSFMSGERY
jgi:hypothetical protein